jgi:geranylgeranyl diphosphate synthase type II
VKKHPALSISIREYLSDYRQEVDQFLDLVLPEVGVNPSSIHEATRYSIFAGGKRIRPILAIATSKALGGKLVDVLPFAAALEMVHTYSIIHDDLPAMDNDDVRRGKQALHKRFGEGVAILAGNALLTQAFELLSSDDYSCDPILQLELIHTMCIGIGSREGMIAGQVLDLLTEGKSYSADDLQSIHELKTGALIHVAVYGAAILLSATPDRLEKLSDFGRNVGLAFQIVDDILDVEGTTAQLGKESGRDCEEQKATYPALFGLEKSKQMALELIEAAIAELGFLGARKERLVELAQFVSVRRF